MRTELELEKELEMIKERLSSKPNSEFYKAYKLCLEWVLSK